MGIEYKAANPEEIYAFLCKLSFPYRYETDFDVWEASYLRDTDGEGRQLFTGLETIGAYDGSRLVGFLQYGVSAVGFNGAGEITQDVSYPIIRNFYFLPGQEAAGAQLLTQGMAALSPEGRQVYAFFHYFGMSCYARHGKLFQAFDHVHRLLLHSGFAVEHENVFYSSLLTQTMPAPVCLCWHEPTCGGQQACDFLLDGKAVGGCELHFLPRPDTAYLRWIFVQEDLRGKGVGSRCMTALKNELLHRGVSRFDTDTAAANLTARRFYERNCFTREGLTRSYHTL